jgi:AP-3 complex subunit beta
VSFFSSVLVDIEEWGQVIIIGMLTRYARTQFTDPNISGGAEGTHSEKEKPFYGESDDEGAMKDGKKEEASLDADHRLLLRNTKPLLQSRNASVAFP